jgi:hypothetical protein
VLRAYHVRPTSARLGRNTTAKYQKIVSAVCYLRETK